MTTNEEAMKDPAIRADIERQLNEQADKAGEFGQAMRARIPQVLDEMAGIKKIKPNLEIRNAVQRALKEGTKK